MAGEDFIRRPVTCTTLLPATGFDMPNDAHLRALAKIVLAAHPFLRDYAERTHGFEDEFKRAFIACGYALRLAEPSKKRIFASFVEDANALLARLGKAAVEGPALLAAIIAHGDVAWRKADPAIGQLLQVALDPFSGRPCSNAWRELLAGLPLLAPLPPPERLVHARDARSQVQLYQQGA